MKRAIGRFWSAPRWAVGQSRKKSLRRCCSSVRRRRPSSPGLCCPWTAAIAWGEVMMIPQPPDLKPDLMTAAIPADERVWVPQSPGVWFRPLLFNTVQGAWANLLKVTRSGVLSRHRHPGPVYGYVIKGQWHYLEHDWVAAAGAF